MKKRILIAGGTGLVGRQVVSELAGMEGVDLHLLLRGLSGTPVLGVSQHVGDPKDWPAMVRDVKPDVVISCLGTTIRTAGSQSAFRAVDYDLPLSIAQAALETGTPHFISVSSVGASVGSANFYLKTKGQLEDALQAMDFERVDMIRPGLLTGGNRAETRTGESIGIMLAPLTDLFMLGPLAKYASTPSAKVAQAIVTLALGSGHGKFIHENDAIRTLAG